MACLLCGKRMYVYDHIYVCMYVCVYTVEDHRWHAYCVVSVCMCVYVLVYTKTENMCICMCVYMESDARSKIIDGMLTVW